MRAALANAVVAPGLVVHELAHATVAQAWADVEIQWGGRRPIVVIDWHAEPPMAAIVLTFLAPVLVGGLTLLVGAQMGGLLFEAPWPVQIWLAINWVVLAGPSLLDLRELHRRLY